VTHRGPVVTAIVVLGGLVGFMTANSAGALVATKASDNKGYEVPAPKPPANSNNGSQGSSQGSQSKPAAPPSSEAPPTSEKPKPPAGPQFPAQAMYAGDTPGGLAIAVAVKGDQASTYLCDGANVEDWLKGTAEDGKVDVWSKNKKAHLVGTLKGKRLVGSVTFRGTTSAFSITTAPPPAGLYRAANGATTIGWIVLPNGKQVGMENTNGAESAAPALDLDKGYVMVNGVRLNAQKVAGDTTWG
jgi:hypothetical protein